MTYDRTLDGTYAGTLADFEPEPPYYQTPDGKVTLYHGHILDVLREMPAESVNCVVTSPPYWSLRKYDCEPVIWGGDPNCPHTLEAQPVGGESYEGKAHWQHEGVSRQETPEAWVKVGRNDMGRDIGGRKGNYSDGEGPTPQMVSAGSTCSLCGGWRGQYGLEPTPELYVEHTLMWMREVKRVLRPDGVLFLNIGDGYCSTPMFHDTIGTDGTLQGMRNADAEGQQESEGTVPSLLHEAIHANLSDRPLECRQGEGDLSPMVSAEYRDATPEEPRASSTAQGGDDSSLRGEVPLLRGDGASVPNPGSHKGRRERSQGIDPLQQEYHTPTPESGLADPGLSTPLLELQSSKSPLRNLPPRPYLKPKDAVLMPFRVALAAQADGWWVRSVIIWAKPNPMPESVRDRPTDAHEYIFLLTKSKTYWYDADAVREPLAPDTAQRYETTFGNIDKRGGREDGFPSGVLRGMLDLPNGRNCRSVWTFPTCGFPDAHFAVFPKELPERCILAGCPEWVCPKCGKARVRVTEIEYKKGKRTGHLGFAAKGGPQGMTDMSMYPALDKHVTTLGWTDCGCGEPFIGGVVLDPFVGSGTTCEVAYHLGRTAWGIDASAKYLDMARERVKQGVLAL